MSKRLLRVFLVLVLGLDVKVPPAPVGEGGGWSLTFNGPGLAILLYGTLATITLVKVLNHLPGAFALRHPLGAVRSGHEYLWGPAILTVLVSFRYTGSLEGREHRYWTANYGSAMESDLPLVAVCVFALLMWSLKLHATMAEANRRLEQGAAQVAEPRGSASAPETP